MSEVADYINKAADEIERRGLTHGTLIDYSSARDEKDCKVCTLGALALVTYGDANDGYEYGSGFSIESAAYDKAVQTVAAGVSTNRDELPHKFNALDMVYEWNDEGGRGAYVRTTEEVVAKLREIASAT